MSEFIGSTVRINCADRSVVGRVKDVTDDRITLANVTCGEKSVQHFDSLVLLAENILELSLVTPQAADAKSSKVRGNDEKKETRCAYVCPTTPVRPMRPMRILKSEEAGQEAKGEASAAKGKFTGAKSAVPPKFAPAKGSRERTDAAAAATSGSGKQLPRRRAFSANFEAAAFVAPEVGPSAANGAARRSSRTGRDSWYQVDVTDLKEEFDFEGNLRQFNKSEFYRQVDQRRLRDSPDGVRSKTGSDDGSQNGTVLSRGRGGASPAVPGGQRKARPGRHDCFEMDVSQMNEDFDFESNLAQFNKSEFYREVDQRRQKGERPRGNSELHSRQPDVVPEPKYRHDENVLTSSLEPSLCPVRLPPTWEKEGVKRFVCQDGVLLTACPVALRRAVFTSADSLGLTWGLVSELFGRSVAELVLEQMGGRTRFRPGNEHQLPHVVLLAGPHLQGALGVALARHLWSRRCRVTLVVPKMTIGEMEMPEEMAAQLQLFRNLTGETVRSDFEKQPSQAVDYIVSALECHVESKNDLLVFQPWMHKYIAMCNANRPPCLVVDPPASRRFIQPRVMVSLGLPLPLALPECNNAAYYLCDVGLTASICKKVGISYSSPFGCRSLLQLTDADEEVEKSSNSTQ